LTLCVQGTVQFFAGVIESQQLTESINLFVGMGPIAHVGHIGNNVLRYMSDWHLDDILLLFGGKDFAPSPTQMSTLFADFCAGCPNCCSDIVEAICGPHQGAFNESRMPVMATHEPGGTSTQNMVHWAQMVQTNEFQKFDYGPLGNFQHYGNTSTPVYNIAQLPNTFPYVLFSGGKDELADPTDVAWLVPHIPHLLYWEELPDYAHLDFVWDPQAAYDIYPKIISYLKEYNN
jgi:hypothetical protein